MMRKRSLTIRGHRTSISLEDPFWEEFQRIAAREGESLNRLAERIDATRDDVGMNLSSAIRIFILNELRRRLEAALEFSAG